MKKLPPLNALRAFEAAARHLSVTLAADELCVTAGAVSRKIKELEEFLDVTLFLRGHQQIALTRHGQTYARVASRVLSELRDATASLGKHAERKELRIRAYTTFAMRWLIPRLSDFHKRHPDVDVSVTTSLEDIDFTREDVDGAIRLGEGQWKGAHCYRLVPNVLIPVLNARLLRKEAPMVTPHDLRHYPLLHSLARPDDWADWLAAVGVRDVSPDGPVFQSSVLVYAAAAQGQGIAMAQRFLVEDDLRAGALQQAFPLELDRGHVTYYLLTPVHRPERPQMTAFREWILEQSVETLPKRWQAEVVRAE